MHLLESLYILDGAIFIYIMVFLIFFIYDRPTITTAGKKNVSALHPREEFCTCRGMQFNNSEADIHQKDCYKNKIPKHIWNKSHAGCTSFDDPGKIAYDYNIDNKQLPQFAGV